MAEFIPWILAAIGFAAAVAQYLLGSGSGSEVVDTVQKQADQDLQDIDDQQEDKIDAYTEDDSGSADLADDTQSIIDDLRTDD
jgi:apolipoprotein N-acyltransferase